MTRRICLALDLVDDAAAIAEYDYWHSVGNADPAVMRSIRDAGIEQMEIFRGGTRLVMVMDVNETYSAEAKAAADEADPNVVAWETKMRQWQRPIPAAGPGGSWHVLDRIFRLTEHPGA